MGDGVCCGVASPWALTSCQRGYGAGRALSLLGPLAAYSSANTPAGPPFRWQNNNVECLAVAIDGPAVLGFLEQSSSDAGPSFRAVVGAAGVAQAPVEPLPVVA